MLGILNTRQISKKINTNTKNAILVAFFQKKSCVGEVSFIV